ncbi:MAG: ARMT1-like domain-containing protein [Candidatus Nezhaarchaeales archaeon]
MKLKPECIPCILDVRRRELEFLELEEEEASKVMIEVTKYMSKILSANMNVTRLASLVYRRFKELTLKDPYFYIRERALSMFNEIKDFCLRVVDRLEGYKRFNEAVKLSLLGNSFDYGVAEFEPPELRSIAELLNSMIIEKDQVPQLYEMSKAAKIVFLLDNVEELPFDYVLLSELKKLGSRVTVIAKSGTFQNDTTIDDARMVGLHKLVDRLIESGSDGSSVFLDEVSEEVKEELTTSNLIIAKGMAHYEYIADTPLKAKTFFLLRAKCKAIARDLGVNVGSYVVLRTP